MDQAQQNNMVPQFNFVAEAMQTASGKYHGNMVPFSYYKDVLEECIAALNKLDGIKKTLFYGRDLNVVNVGQANEISMMNVPFSILGNDERGVLLLHGILGGATEKCELLEHLHAITIEHKNVDSVNIAEEIGDGHWYDALLSFSIGLSFYEIQRMTIRKLRTRFPNSFTEYDANHRKLGNERNVMENAIASGFAPVVTKVE